MQKSLADLDTDMLVSSDDIFGQKRKLLKHLFAAEDKYAGTLPGMHQQDDARLLWKDMMSSTPQGIREIQQISASQPTDLAERVRLYEQNEAERVMVPKTSEQRNEAARRFFGRLLAMNESPFMRNETSLCQTDASFRPSSVRFMILLARYLHRIPGRCPTHVKEYSEQPRTIWHDLNLLLYGDYEEQSHPHAAVDCVKASQRWLKLASLLGDAAYFMGRTEQLNRHPFLDVESVVESGTDGEFSRFERLLSRNGSWIGATCLELSGLAQALSQVSDTYQLARIQSFQRLLHRKCRNAFGEVAPFERRSKLSYAHKVIVEHVGRELLDLIPPPSQVEEGHRWVRGILVFAILEAIEDMSRGKKETPAKAGVLAWISYPISLALVRFSRMYIRGIAARDNNWPGPERMTRLLHEAIEKFAAWYIPWVFEPQSMSQGAREEALKAFRDIISG